MEKIPGLYVTLKNNGIIKRTLVTNKGETVLDETTVGAELIWFAELDYHGYTKRLSELEELSEQTENDDPDHYGEVDLDIFDELLLKTNDLVYNVEDNFPLLGSLLRFDLYDHTTKDDGTAMYVYNTKHYICMQVAEPVQTYIKLREVFHDLSFGIPLDFEGKYADLVNADFTVCHSYCGTLDAQYRFRSTQKYIQFLLMQFLNSEPNIAWCYCCGQYFIPKTRKATKYCDRIIRDGKTCKEIAPAIMHKIAVETDPVVKAFERNKQKMYKRYERTTWTDSTLPKGISFEDYLSWRENASEARDKYIKGELTEKEALNIIEVKD